MPQRPAARFHRAQEANVKLRHAYDDNLTHHRAEILRLFLTNSVCILSNALETRVGSFSLIGNSSSPGTAPDDEKGKIDREAVLRASTSPEDVLAGLLPKARRLDYLENLGLLHAGRAKKSWRRTTSSSA